MAFFMHIRLFDCLWAVDALFNSIKTIKASCFVKNDSNIPPTHASAAAFAHNFRFSFLFLFDSAPLVSR